MSLHPKSIYKKKREKQESVRELDKSIAIQIKGIIEERPTYGYKRVTALCNRERKKRNLKTYNKKRIYRIMKEQGLLLPKTQSSREPHKATGQIMTLHSNLRWCSDAFEIRCFNEEKVYVAFILDCHDRECLSYTVSSNPLLGENIESLLIMGVEKRFGKLHTDREVEFLTDRGGIYRSRQVLSLAKELGLKSCFTRAYSPESNGMAEAFVKTIKRDYVYVNDCVDAKGVIDHLEGWIEDYNQKAPHSALDMRSPMEYIQFNEIRLQKEGCI